MKTGIIFDMDGTLWDSAANVAASWSEVVKRRAVDRPLLTEADIKSIMGMTMDAIAEKLFNMVPEQERHEIMHECEVYENEFLREHGGVLYPELEETLIKLKERGYHLYIVSNCQSGYIETFLDHYHMWTHFEDIECYGNTLQGKDVNVRTLAERNQLDKYYYVGDIQADYDSSTAGGAEFIHAAYGFGQVRQDVARIRTFAELTEVLPEIR